MNILANQNSAIDTGLPVYSGEYVMLSDNEIKASPKFPDKLVSEFNGNQCYLNSYKAAAANDDIVVEGIIAIFSEGKLIDTVRHAWNKSREGHYYDVTKDYVWNTPEFLKRSSVVFKDSKPTYIYFVCNEYSRIQIKRVDSEGRDFIGFHYNYDNLQTQLKNIFSTPFSVLMSVYRNNNPDELQLAIESIYTLQIFRPTEVIVVIDGPVPKEINKIIDELKVSIPILKTIPLVQNVGLGKALNIGMQNVSFELTARMDTDDISLPDRFLKQVEFMSLNPDIAVCGGQISEFIDHPENIVGYRKVPTDPSGCRKYFQDRDPLNHMTVMLRKSAVMEAGNYLPWHLDEDTYLWGRILKKGFKIANLPDILVNVRVGKEMYARRGGWKYFKSDVKILKWKLDNGLTGYGRYAYNYLVRFAVQVLMPNRLRGWVFKRLLRQH